MRNFPKKVWSQTPRLSVSDEMKGAVLWPSLNGSEGMNVGVGWNTEGIS